MTKCPAGLQNDSNVNVKVLCEAVHCDGMMMTSSTTASFPEKKIVIDGIDGDVKVLFSIFEDFPLAAIRRSGIFFGTSSALSPKPMPSKNEDGE